MARNIAKDWEDEKYSDEYLQQRLRLCRKPEGDDGIQLAHEMNESHSTLVSWAMDTYSQNQNITGKALDVGCGGGATLKAVHTRYPNLQLYGIDYSTDMVELSKKNLQKQAEIINGSVLELPYGNAEFTYITAVETTYFWPEITESLKNVFRVLNDNGTFQIIQEMYADTEDDTFRERNERIVAVSGMQLFTPEALKEQLLTAGFTQVQYTTKSENNWITYLAQK